MSGVARLGNGPRIGIASLTTSELQVCERLLEGKTNRQIASLLFLSQQTIKFHLSSIYRKLNVTDRLTAVLKLQETFALAATSECCGHEIYTPFCPWCGTARVIAAPVEAAA